MSLDLASAQARLQEYLDAESQVLRNQSYKIGDREMTRADLRDIRDGITFWQGQVDRLSRPSGGRRMRLGTPV